MDIWAFLSDPENREVLSWLGGGLVVIAGGAWTVMRFFLTRPSPAGPRVAPPAGWLLVLAVAGAMLLATLLAASFAGNRVTATNGVAVGGDVGGDVTVGAPAPAGR